jgi:hypothetical protein
LAGWTKSAYEPQQRAYAEQLSDIGEALQRTTFFREDYGEVEDFCEFREAATP